MNDANGNRATKTLNSVTDTYVNDDADKLTSITRGGSTIKSFTYDAAGRTTEVTVGANTTEFDYDYEDRLVTITYPNLSTNTFTYNAHHARASKVDSSGTQTYMRDGISVTSPVLSDSVANYTPRISERRASTTKYFHSDQLGSTERLTNGSQTTTDTRMYDAFGSLVNSTGSTSSPFGFVGRGGYQDDSDSGLKLLGSRYYDPSLGRFITRDRGSHGRNWYTYCDNNPVTRADSSGYDWHAPMIVYLEPGFEGTVTIIGEPYPGGSYDDQVWYHLPPGHTSHPGMDVDYLIIDRPGQEPDIVFLPGLISDTSSDTPQHTVIDAGGNIKATGPVWGHPRGDDWTRFISPLYTLAVDFISISWVNKVSPALDRPGPPDRAPIGAPAQPVFIPPSLGPAIGGVLGDIIFEGGMPPVGGGGGGGGGGSW
jgi:RHS repeat-associated protein